MVGAPVQHTRMDVGARSPGEAFKEVVDEFSLQVAHQPLAYFGIDNAGCAPAEIDCREAEGFIHGHDKISGAQDPALRPKRLVKCLSQNDAYIFHRVVLVKVECALRPQFEVESTVAGKQLQHVIKEPDAGRHLVLAPPINVKHRPNRGFLRLSLDRSPSHAGVLSPQPISFSVSRSAPSRRSVCSCQPAVMRTQPSQPKSEDRSRTRIPRVRIPRPKSAWLGPIRASTKFAWLGQKGISRARNSSSNRLRLHCTSAT